MPKEEWKDYKAWKYDNFERRPKKLKVFESLKAYLGSGQHQTVKEIKRKRKKRKQNEKGK